MELYKELFKALNIPGAPVKSMRFMLRQIYEMRRHEKDVIVIQNYVKRGHSDLYALKKLGKLPKSDLERLFSIKNLK